MSSCVATPVLALLHRQREQSTQEQHPWGSAPCLSRHPATPVTADKGGHKVGFGHECSPSRF